MKYVKYIAALVILAVIGALGFFWLRSPGSQPGKRYYTDTVKTGNVVNSISATGTVEPEELINVGTQIGGMIQSFGTDTAGKSVDYGSTVKAGMLLAEIDDTLFVADVKSAEAELAQRKSALARAKADMVQLQSKLELAKANLKRADELLPHKAISQSDYDIALSAKLVAEANIDVGEADILQAEAAVNAAEANLSRSKSNLAYCTIYSPVDGVIIDRRVNIGQTVVASMSTPSLFLIAKDLRKMQVWVSVNEADIGHIRIGMPVEFGVDAFPGESFKGNVGKIRLNASLTQNVVTYIVEVQADNSDLKLLPYLTANTRFIVDSAENKLTVPNAALRWVPSKAERVQNKKGEGTVWIPGPKGEAIPKTVKILLTDGVTTAIETDLPEGTKVITGVAAETVGQAPPQEAASSPFLPKMKAPK